MAGTLDPTLDLEEFTGADTSLPTAMPLRKRVSAGDLGLPEAKVSSVESSFDGQKTEAQSIDIDQVEDHGELTPESTDSSDTPSGIWQRFKQPKNEKKVPAGIKQDLYDLIQTHVTELVDSLNKELKRQRRLYMTDVITGKKVDVMFEFKQEGKVWHIQSRHKSLLNNKIFPLISLFFKPSSTKPKLMWRGMHTEGLREVLLREDSMKEAFEMYLERCVKMKAEKFNIYGKHIPRAK